MSAYTKQFRSRTTLRSDRFEPLCTILDNHGNTRQCFNVVNDRRAAEQSIHRWEWRLDPWVGSFAFEGFNQSSLFTTDVCTSTTMHIHIQIIASAENILTKVSLGIRLGNLLF